MSSACLYPAHISGADLSGFLEITFVDLLGSDNQEIDLKNVRTGKTAKVACYVFSNSTSTQSSNEISLRFDLVYEGTQQTKKINFKINELAKVLDKTEDKIREKLCGKKDDLEAGFLNLFIEKLREEAYLAEEKAGSRKKGVEE
jgi:hypothetical protein